ncbi:acetylornithine deacetylase [Striga asiatica]|uniref:Acetylornithine deacetylase n=1 Tax=Striga asiatica TaxID=4170 RepID=A0A5A7P1A9_STRAF|nr:acetylornithine deacetylase [Striga asiatica]
MGNETLDDTSGENHGDFTAAGGVVQWRHAAVEGISLRRRRDDCHSDGGEFDNRFGCCRRQREGLSQGGLPAGSLTNDLAVVGASGGIVAVRSAGVCRSRWMRRLWV